jgi:hypothetical protein
LSLAVRLDASTASNARSGRQPRFVSLPGLGDQLFADLNIVAPINKAALKGVPVQHGVTTDSEARKLAQAIGRWFSRFPFPDDVVPWLRPLQSLAQSKASSAASPEGQIFGRVAELRVESDNGWYDPPYDLKLTVIVNPGELPTFPEDDVPPSPDSLMARLRPGGALAAASQVAAMLLVATDPVDRYWLWQAIGEAWADRCKPDLAKVPPGERAAVAAAVMDGGLAAEVVSADEYTLSQYRRSELLDLSHLSPPLPLE